MPVSDHTSLHCLSCLFCEHGSFSSQPRSSSGVVFALGKGTAKTGYLPPAWANLPYLCTPCSPASLQHTLRHLSYSLAARATESEDMGTQKTAYVTDSVTLLNTVDSGGFKWGKEPNSSELKAQRQPCQGRAIAY